MILRKVSDSYGLVQQLRLRTAHRATRASRRAVLRHTARGLLSLSVKIEHLLLAVVDSPRPFHG